MVNKAQVKTSPASQVYQIVSTRDQIAVGDDGRLQEVKVINFTTPLGDNGHVTLPKAHFTAEAARTMIEAEISELIALRGG